MASINGYQSPFNRLVKNLPFQNFKFKPISHFHWFSMKLRFSRSRLLAISKGDMVLDILELQKIIWIDFVAKSNVIIFHWKKWILLKTSSERFTRNPNLDHSSGPFWSLKWQRYSWFWILSTYRRANENLIEITDTKFQRNRFTLITVLIKQSQ